jgi:hypothetical protein
VGKKDEDATRGDGPLRLVEKEHFTHARCECGWRGPGRRSRKRAREDAAKHLDDRCKAVSK